MPDFFDLAEAEERRARIEKAAAEHAAFLKYEEEQEAASRERATALSIRANESIIITQYHHAGVEAPIVDERGVPKVSLELLLKMGWKIESALGRNVMTKPPPETKPRKRREDYDQST